MTIEEAEERWEICRHCPICNQEKGLCSAELYLNPQTNDISTSPKEGYIKGCGCIISLKIQKEKSKCPANKW